MNISIRLREIYFKIAARSKYFRENFAEIEAAINNLQWQINQGIIPDSASEVVNARNYASTLSERLDNIFSLMPNAVIEGGEVKQSIIPDMALMVYATSAVINGIYVERGFGSWTRSTATITITEAAHDFTTGDKIYCQELTGSGAIPEDEYTVTVVDVDTFEITGVDAGDTSGLIKFARFSGTVTAPTTNTRLDRVMISADNSISIAAGTESIEPFFNDVADTDLCLGGLVTKAATTTLRDNYEIFQFSGITTDKVDAYIHTKVYSGGYHFNNVIVDDSVAVWARGFDSVDKQIRLNAEAFPEYFVIRCDGYYSESLTAAFTKNVSINKNNAENGLSVSNSGNTVTVTGADGGDWGYYNYIGYLGSLAAGFGGNGSAGGQTVASIEGGGGGGGGGSIIGIGGAGGDGQSGNAGAWDDGSQGQGGSPYASMLIDAMVAKLAAGYDCAGQAGTAGGAGALSGGGGGGGAGGGIHYVRADDVIILQNITIDVRGGDGGSGNATGNDGGGGGGGAGGLSLIIYKDTITNAISIGAYSTGGSGGVSVGGSNGADGDDGYNIFAQYDNNLISNLSPSTLEDSGRHFDDIIGRY